MAFRAMGEGSQPYVAFDEEKANPPGGRERGDSAAPGRERRDSAAVQHSPSRPRFASDEEEETQVREEEGWWARCCRRRRTRPPRLVRLNAMRSRWGVGKRYPENVTINTKYTPLTFVPLVLFEQFRYFFNLYFLVTALSQFYAPLRIGLLVTYIAPLCFVLCVTMAKEAYDDVARARTDRELNDQNYTRITKDGRSIVTRARDLAVGDVIQVNTDERVPADLVLLRTSNPSGVLFLRTDQLDGETDWKPRLAVPSTHRLSSDAEVCSTALAPLRAARPSLPRERPPRLATAPEPQPHVPRPHARTPALPALPALPSPHRSPAPSPRCTSRRRRWTSTTSRASSLCTTSCSRAAACTSPSLSSPPSGPTRCSPRALPAEWWCTRGATRAPP